MSHQPPHASPRLGGASPAESSQPRPPMLRLASTSELEGMSASRMRSRSISSVRNGAHDEVSNGNGAEASGSSHHHHHHHHGASSSSRLSRPEPVSRVTVAPVMGPASSHEFALNDPMRGPGTPDFTIQQPWRSSHASSPKGKAKASEVPPTHMPRELGNPSKPRIGSQLRSFFSSIGGSSSSSSEPEPSAGASATASSTSTAGPSKARNSDEFKDLGGSARADRVQSLSSSAFALANNNEPGRVLVMPSARMGTPSGLALNDDSPPLTPSDETSHHPPPFLGQAGHEGTSSRWSSQYGPFSAASHSTSSAASDRASPVFSHHSNGSMDTISPPTRPGSSIPPSLGAGAKTVLHSQVRNEGLLPTTTLRTSASIREATPNLSSASPLRSIQRAVQRHLPVRALRLSSLRARAAKLPALAPHFPALLFLMICFVGSTVALLLGLSTLPIRLPAHKITELTMDEIRDACLSLRDYSRSSMTASVHTLVLLCALFTWKQAFNIPGSLIMNVVFGAMYGTIGGAFYSSVFTAVGGVLCYLLVAPLGPLIAALPGLNKPLSVMRKALGPSASRNPDGRRSIYGYGRNRGRRQFSLRRTWAAHTAGPIRLSNLRLGATAVATNLAKAATQEISSQSSLWSYLLVLRVLPVVPYGLMNIAASVLRVPLLPFAGTLLVGSMPWNAMTAQVGDLLIEVVQAFPAGPGAVGDLASQLDQGGFSDAPFDGPLTLGAAAGAGLDAEKARIAEAARKAQGGMKAIAAKVWTREMLVKLVFLSILSLAPMLLTRWLKGRKHGDGEDEGERNETHELFDANDNSNTNAVNVFSGSCATSQASPRQPMATLALFEANLGSPRKARGDDMESLLRNEAPLHDSFDVRPQSPMSVEEHAAKRAAALSAQVAGTNTNEGISRPSSRLSKAWGWEEMVGPPAPQQQQHPYNGKGGGFGRSTSQRSPTQTLGTRKMRASVHEGDPQLGRSRSARTHVGREREGEAGRGSMHPTSASMNLLPAPTPTPSYTPSSSKTSIGPRSTHARQGTDTPHLEDGHRSTTTGFESDEEDESALYEDAEEALETSDDVSGWAGAREDEENPYDTIVRLQDAAAARVGAGV